MTGIRTQRNTKVDSLLQAQLRDNPGFLLAQSARVMREKLSDALSGTGMSLQELTILRLLASAGPMNQQELGKNCNLDKTTITELIDSLESAGLARREVSDTDRRSKQISITPGGKRALTKATKRAGEAEREFMELLSQREWTVLRNCLSRYLDANDGKDGKG
jgi:DNA-binding MarR family transcriptional regulator